MLKKKKPKTTTLRKASKVAVSKAAEKTTMQHCLTNMATITGKLRAMFTALALPGDRG